MAKSKEWYDLRKQYHKDSQKDTNSPSHESDQNHGRSHFGHIRVVVSQANCHHGFLLPPPASRNSEYTLLAVPLVRAILSFKWKRVYCGRMLRRKCICARGQEMRAMSHDSVTSQYMQFLCLCLWSSKSIRLSLFGTCQTLEKARSHRSPTLQEQRPFPSVRQSYGIGGAQPSMFRGSLGMRCPHCVPFSGYKTVDESRSSINPNGLRLPADAVSLWHFFH